MPARLTGGILRGAAAGLIGAAVMTAFEKLEQSLTGRPNSFVPGRTLAHLLDLSDPDRDSLARNWAMHYATGAAGGVLRGAMSASNLRGLGASVMHTQLRRPSGSRASPDVTLNPRYLVPHDHRRR